MKSIKNWVIESRGGAVGVRDIARREGVSETPIRDWAFEHDLPKVGNAFVFGPNEAEACLADLVADDDDDLDLEDDGDAGEWEEDDEPGDDDDEDEDADDEREDELDEE